MQRGRRGRAVGARQNRRERHPVLDRLVRALPQMRQHRVRGIAEQAEPPVGPGRQRLAVVERPAERRLHVPQQLPDTRVPAGEFAAQTVRIAGRRPRLLHLLVGRHEAHIVDHLSGAHRKGEEMLSRAEPHLPALDRPMRNAFMRHEAPVGDGAVEHRPRRRKRIRPQLGMDAVGRDHDVGLRRSAVGEGRRAPRSRPA